MFFYFRPKTKEVVMIAEIPLESSLPFFEFEPSPEEQEKINQNYELFEEKGTIKFRIPEKILLEERQEIIKRLKEEIKTATTLQEIKGIVQALLNNL